MPGSPYLEETPSGLLTWQRFTMIGILVAASLIGIGIYFDVLTYVITAIIVIGTVRYLASN